MVYHKWYKYPNVYFKTTALQAKAFRTCALETIIEIPVKLLK